MASIFNIIELLSRQYVGEGNASGEYRIKITIIKNNHENFVA